ncbi:MAG TPA: polysaccharide deacetylase family protein [Anaerolineae bacterium]|nr:polysaccharide deacetylase family protein [Anaerolineae bacterium]
MRATLLLIAIILASLALAGCAAAPFSIQSATGSAVTEVAIQHDVEATPVQPVVPTITPTAAETPTATPTPQATPTPWPTPDGVARQARVPILMYHYLSDPPPGADRYRRDLSVSPALFEQHLAYLQAQGYQSITLYDLLYHLTQGAPLPDKPVIITFDDGYRDNYANAFPLLQQVGFDATFFVLVEVTNQGEAEYLTWDMMREMQAAGMEIECHARVHENLPENDDQRLVWQVLGCREALESELGQRPRFISYPSGRFDERVAAFFASDNYWGGITTQQGTLHSSDALFEIKRLRVRNTTTVDLLAELLAFQE